jgi:hypothetical protein
VHSFSSSELVPEIASYDDGSQLRWMIARFVVVAAQGQDKVMLLHNILLHGQTGLVLPFRVFMPTDTDLWWRTWFFSDFFILLFMSKLQIMISSWTDRESKTLKASAHR